MKGLHKDPHNLAIRHWMMMVILMVVVVVVMMMMMMMCLDIDR